ncbi:APOD [Branchiostoma lanceolatum]|uniref:Apolipoprotein D n=1 Tax=Branchiostoma lanceolatum TaxID=7740 RepID=A0A8K0AG17_BRALA|nr:APOD [Branchiostoma lanceolatum]
MAFFPLLPLALALLSVTLVEGQVIGLGKCPEVKVQEDFDISQYLGAWHEIEKFTAYFEAGKCLRANYTLKPDGHVIVDNEENVNGEVKKAIGDAYIPDPKEAAKIAVRFYSFAPYGPYWVLKTDYKTYTLVWSCVDLLNLTNAQFMWILARERELDPATVDELHKLATGYGIDVTHFSKTDQTGCDS